VAKQMKLGCPVPYFPPAELVGFGAQMYEQQGLDFILNGDQLNLAIPRSICTPDIVPAVTLDFDLDLWMEGFLISAMAAAATTSLGIAQCCDAVRRPASLLAQQLLTMDHLTKGRFFLCIGAGEQKQFSPYGLERRKPFLHVQESMRVMRRLVTSPEPINYDGPIWTLRNAIMRLMPYEQSRPPKVCVLGGPGKAVELAETAIREGDCDGFATWMPPAGDPEWWNTTIARLRKAAVDGDRDPDDLNFVCMMTCLIYANDDEREFFEQNMAMRFHAALETPGAGATWERWGPTKNPLGDDYFYARDFVPMDWTREETLRIAKQVPPAMVSKSKLLGNPASVAEQIIEYVGEPGTTHLLLGNFADILRSGDWADASEQRNLVGETLSVVRNRTSAILS